MVILFLTTRTLIFQCLLLNHSLTKTEKLNSQVSYQKPLQKLLPRRVVEVEKLKKPGCCQSFLQGRRHLRIRGLSMTPSCCFLFWHPV